MKKYIDIDIDKILSALFAFIIALAICTLITMCTSSCTRTVYEPVETVRYVDRDNVVWKIDSVYMHDSVMIEKIGDTVWQTKWRDRYQISYIHDSLYINKVDSVRIPYTVEVEKKVIPTPVWYIIAGCVLTIIVMICILRIR